MFVVGGFEVMVVVLVKDEVENLLILLDEIEYVFKGWVFEVIVVDDGLSDGIDIVF